MKKVTKSDYSQFKKIANKISLLIKTGKWDSLESSVRQSLSSRLLFYYNKVKQFFSRRKLSRALGASYILLAGTSATAQTFDPPVFNAFNLQAPGNYLNKVDFVDIDNDGDLDMFTNGYYGVIRFQENIGTANVPNFAPAVENPFGLDSVANGYTYSCDLADIDGDGDMDLFLSGYYGNITFFENIGTAIAPDFGPQQVGPFNMPGANGYLIMSDIVDIDGDGDLDLLGFQLDYNNGNGFAFFENTGTPTTPSFAAPVLDTFNIDMSATTYYFDYADFADLDLDGDLDMISTSYYGTELFYYENVGTATAPNFAPAVNSPFNISPITNSGYFYTISPTFADLDGDGDQDILISEYYNNILFYENIQYNLSIDQSDQVTDLQVFPNPTRDILRFSTTELSGDVSLNILSIDGKLVYTLKDADLTEIDVSALDIGTYILEIRTHDDRLFRSQFVKL